MLRSIKEEQEPNFSSNNYNIPQQLQETLIQDNVQRTAKYFNKEDEPNSSPGILKTTNQVEQQSQLQEISFGDDGECPSSSKHMKVDINALPADPGKRPMIEFYHACQRDDIRKAYLQKGPCQPRNHSFPQRKIGASVYKFNPAWFDEYKYWLEYSIEEDAAYCLCCYLFKDNGSLAFVKYGFKDWNKRERLSFHNAGNQHILAVQKCKNLMNQLQSITTYKKVNAMVHDDDDNNVDVDVDWTPTSAQTANKKKRPSTSSGMKGLEKKIEVLLEKHEEKIIKTLLKKQGEQFAVLAGLLGREVLADDLAADKRARLNEELKKISNLSLQAQLQAASVIVGDRAKLDLFYSLSCVERKEWVMMLISGLIL